MKASDLKASILQLAVSGKLVFQDPNDEPVSVLLKRIKDEREQFIKEGKIKKGKPLAEISLDEIPFEVPESWEWVRLRDIIQLISGRDLTPEEYTDKMCGIPYLIGASNVEDGIITVERWTEQPKVISLADDLLLSCKGTVGKTAIQKLPQAHIARQFMSLRPYFGIDIFYFKIFIDNYVPILISQAKSMIPGISREDVLPILCPLPPLAEQQRIVARIEELMPLVEAYDREEQKLSALEAGFPDALRQSILQYAVEGKLVPQKAEDGTAAELLVKIRKERDALVKEGKIRKGTPLSPVSEEEKPFDIPASWEWVRLGNLLTRIGSGSTPTGGRNVYQTHGIPFIRSQNVYNDGLRLQDVAFISDEINNSMKGTAVQPKDILLNITGASIGRCAVVPDDFIVGNVNQHVSILRCIAPELREYLHTCICSPYFQKIIMEKQVGLSREGLSAERLKQFSLPLPPLAEQHRIVERIEELKGLCDRIPKKVK